MKLRIMISAIAVVALATSAGCDKKPEGSSPPGAGSAASTKSPTAASNLPVKGPWEAIKVSITKKDADGTTHFTIQNLGGKTVTQIFFDMYAYDAKGKQLVHKDRGFSREIKGGATDEFAQDPVKDADTWEAVYHGIQFEGDASPTMDYKRAPAQRPKGG